MYYQPEERAMIEQILESLGGEEEEGGNGSGEDGTSEQEQETDGTGSYNDTQDGPSGQGGVGN